MPLTIIQSEHGIGACDALLKVYITHCVRNGVHVNKKDKDKYLDVILNKRSVSGVNRGFRVMNNKMCTYVQVKNAFSYFYPKRKVL